jgi:hypothetical protein
MFGKNRALALALATAGAIGLGAPMASAATTSIAGDQGGILSVSNNQAPVDVSGTGVAAGLLGTATAGALSGPAGGYDRVVGRSAHASATGCKCGSGRSARGISGGESWATAGGGGGALINANGNRVPVNVSGTSVAAGVLSGAEGGLAGVGILSPLGPCQ